MKIYNKIEELRKDLTENKDLIFPEEDIEIRFNLPAGEIENINVGNINAKDIDACNINAGDIDAWNITAKDINACNIDAWNITAKDIDAGDITVYLKEKERQK